MRVRPVLTGALAAAGLALVTAAGGASAGPAFTSASAATVRPGVQTSSPAGQCTANFLFTDPTGAVYVGQSAHCTGLGEATDTDGCTTGSLPLGTQVRVSGATRPAVLVYSSWTAMQRFRDASPQACAANDFALLRLDPADVGRANPTVPFFGGPNALDRDGTRAGERVATYGNSSLRLGLTALSPKRGQAVGDRHGGWTHDVFTVTPGIPGDSGSAVLNAQGAAIGTLSTVSADGTNGVSDLQKQMAYARLHGMPGLVLVPGTVPFKGVDTLR